MPGKKILVTGGLGFLGSNLSIPLIKNGHDVTILDSLIPGLGGDENNILPIKDSVRIVKGDVRDEALMLEVVKRIDIVYHFAGQVDHHRSMINPREDLDIRCCGTLNLLEALRINNPKAKLIFASTRAVYGSQSNLPVDESATTNPLGVYAATSLAAEKLISVYSGYHGIPSCILRITNTYGPRHQMKKSYGLVNWFIRQALTNTPLTVMGGGETIRDFLFVSDAVDAMIKAQTDVTSSKVYNLASAIPVTFIELANEIAKLTGATVIKSELSSNMAKIDPGDFVANNSKIKKDLSWTPTTSLTQGLQITIDFYKANKSYF